MNKRKKKEQLGISFITFVRKNPSHNKYIHLFTTYILISTDNNLILRSFQSKTSMLHATWSTFTSRWLFDISNITYYLSNPYIQEIFVQLVKLSMINVMNNLKTHFNMSLEFGDQDKHIYMIKAKIKDSSIPVFRHRSGCWYLSIYSMAFVFQTISLSVKGI